MPPLEQFKQFLVTLLTEAREHDKKATGVARIAIDANIRLLEREIVYIAKALREGLDMEKARSEIKVIDEGTIKEIGRARRDSPVTSRLIELANELKPGKFKEVDPKLIEPTHFSTRVYNLRAANAIPHDVKPKQNVNGKKGLFLVRLTKEQMSVEPKHRGKVKANGN